jgi:hypothetical protein
MKVKAFLSVGPGRIRAAATSRGALPARLDSQVAASERETCPNRTGAIPREGYSSGVAGATVRDHERAEELQSTTLAKLGLESPAAEGDSPVGESVCASSGRFPSSAGHVEARTNSGGPSPKAEYSLATGRE